MMLRTQVMRGGAYLAVRHGMGTLINVVGILVLIRMIGPIQYGIFAAALGLFTALHLMSRGIGVFLVRRETDVSQEIADQASSILLLLGIGTCVLGLLTLPLVHSWSRLQGLMRFTIALYAALPLAAVAQVPLSRLERSLVYRRLTYVELAAQSLFFAVAIPLAYLGYGAWAAVLGWWAQHAVAYGLYYQLAGYRPRWQWNKTLVREIVSYGSGYTASIWLAALRRLVNPMLVGRYLGAEAVAIVAVTTQIVAQLGFVAAAAWRLYPAALGRVQTDSARLVRAIGDGMPLQILLVGPFLVLFAWASGLVVPYALGQTWTPVVALFPYLAIAHLVNVAFNMHVSALYVLRYNVAVICYNAAAIVLLTVAGFVLVPKMGLIGYGVAELASLGSIAVLHVYTLRTVGSPKYGAAIVLLFAFSVTLFWDELRAWSLIGLLIVILAAKPWRHAVDVIEVLRGSAPKTVE